jgi:hypothetical protein
MNDWLLKEREQLLQRDMRAIIKANAIILILWLALVGGAYAAAHAMGLRGALVTTGLILLLLFVAPLISLILTDWLRTRLWLLSAHEKLRRLRAMRFLTHYVDLVGRTQVDALPDPVREKVDRALRKERDGYLVPEKDYARALQVVLHLEPPAGRTGHARERWDPDSAHG